VNPPENQKDPSSPLAQRFRGFLPVIIDVETGGFNPETDALLEIAAVTIRIDDDGFIHRHETFSFHIEPFEGANIEKAALDFTGIDLDSPDRLAEPELMALTDMMQAVRRSVKENGCTRAVVVGHNAHFDLNFLNAAIERCDLKRSPFHPFSVFDTATLAGLAYGQTVLAKACRAAGLKFSNSSAHSAAYDAELTADLFCTIVNKWKEFGGWPIAVFEDDEEAE
jgi:ribonuclease T